ncbi:MAG: aspartyl protease family protein [Bythopirellula sp.]|nr:aspartyl protease family protein [Bythopirellula sp.]
MFARTLLGAWALTCSMVTWASAEVPLGGFIPLVGISLTDEFKDAGDLSGTFFIADKETSLVGTQISGTGNPYYDIALLDTGAATHILTPQAAGTSGFDINGNDFDGTNTQIIGGATGQLVLDINDPLAIFAKGLAGVPSGSTLVMNPSGFRGQSSVATLSAPNEWKLPNILGLPMAAQHSISIKNSEPQIFTLGGRTVRTPQVEFNDLGSGSNGIVRRAPLKIRPGASFIAGPLYIQNLDILGGNFDFHENPLSPTIIESGGLFIDVDMVDGTRSFQDKEFLFDTGADLTVVSEITAARLGFDPILDTPDFILEVEGSGGVSGGVPGFYIDELNIDTVGGTFTLHNVPIAVLDVTNPNDPGNVIDGILGMHLFTGRDLVIDANPSIGQGGIGPSLYISNPVTQTHVWTSTIAQTSFNTATNWTANGTPDVSWVAELRNTAIPSQFVGLTGNTTVNQLVVEGTASNSIALQLTGTQTFTTFGETRIEQGGTISLLSTNSKLDAPFVNIEGGVLRGSGTVFVGTGPINGVVRNLGGRVEPGSTIGKLSITGDFSNLDAGTLAIQLGGTTAITQYDVLAMSRFAFLDGTLEVSLANGFVPAVGNMFTFLTTAADGVFGEFENLLLPAGFQWDVDYLASSVVLKVLGLGTACDFDGDGDVDGRDFLAWQRNPSVGNLADWQANYNNGSLSALAAVPEPSALVLVICAIGFYSSASSRRRQPAV